MNGNKNELVLPDLPSKCLYDKNNLANNPHPKITRNVEQKIYPNVLHIIGNTPLIRLNRIPKSMGIECDILVKCEFLNPGGSIKDRIALSMIEVAEQQGVLKPGSVLVEPTSGNTGVALAMSAAVKGYQSMFVLPEKSSSEKVDILKALGSEIIRTPDNIPYNQPGGIFPTAGEIQRKTPGSVILHQFHNAFNPLAHYYGTATEIFEQCDGKIDMIALGAGTGGTVTGIGRKFKELVPECVIVGVDPYGSTIAEPQSMNQTDVKYFEIEGIGHTYLPQTLDKRVVDVWFKVHDDESLDMARRLIKEEGLLCGGSSGSILCGALKAAKSLKKGQKCVVVLPDGVTNYLTKFVSDYWMEVRNFIPCKNVFNHWWWDFKVSELNLKFNVAVAVNSTCEETLSLMENLNVQFLPVLNSNNNVQGTVSVRDITKLLLNSHLTPEATIERAVNEKYKPVTKNSTLGILSQILDNEKVAIVVEENENELNEPSSKLLAVLYPTDFLQYISSNSI